MLFDTHAHYDSGAFNADRMEVLAFVFKRHDISGRKVNFLC